MPDLSNMLGHISHEISRSIFTSNYSGHAPVERILMVRRPLNAGIFEECKSNELIVKILN
jgi:hypothetical protein